jgi:hypothetical protein
MSSRMSHVWAVLCTTYGVLAFESVTQGDSVFRELVLARGGAIDTLSCLRSPASGSPTARRTRHRRGPARPVGADKLDDATFEEAINSCRTPCITRSAPAGWAATTPAWWIRSIRGHTHGPSVLIGDKATDLIRA